MHATSVTTAAAVVAAALAAGWSPIAQAEPGRHVSAYRTALAPADPAVTPYSAGDGTYRLTLDMQSFAGLAGRLEFRHSQYFVDDNLKGLRSRNSAFWSVRWRF